MAKWHVDVNGTSHEVVYKKTFSGAKIIIDGNATKIKSLNWFINIIDYPINIDSRELRVVVIGNMPDLVVDGFYTKSKKPYVPIANIPAWIWVLVGLSTLGGFFLSGIFSLGVGLFMSTLYIQLAFNKKMGGIIAAFIGCTVIQFAIFVFLVYINL